MAINRYNLIHKHNPIHRGVDITSPLTVGNGEFAFTADVTGLQSLYDEYEEVLPLCTMSQWGWHTKPVNETRYDYTLDDLVMTEYDYNGRTVKYPKKKMEGNEEVYDWLRHNPHRLNLGQIGLQYKNAPIKAEDITEVYQELHLYKGKIVSKFKLHGILCTVETTCDPIKDMLGVQIISDGLTSDDLQVFIGFPYGSHTKSGSDWESNHLHKTEIYGMDSSKSSDGLIELKNTDDGATLKRTLDCDSYYVACKCNHKVSYRLEQHKLTVKGSTNHLDITVGFGKEEIPVLLPVKEIEKRCVEYWKSYWETGGIVNLSKSKDERAVELERRIILSQYLLAINSCGSTPPQETGLTCNSWYGKMHLEMYLWHCAWAPLWNHTELLERSLGWYLDHMDAARENAERNMYKGCRWPKMIATEGIDCPSQVAPLLVWQQPHIIFMLELAYRQNKSKEFLEKYYVLIEETAEFMVDFVVYNEKTKKYEIVAPVIPVQECHKQDITRNPAFEVEYWRYTLKVAVDWAKRLGKNYDKAWVEVGNHMADLAIENKLYLAHENAPDSFTAYNRDHPSMLQAYGVLPNDRIDETVMKNTLNKVIECWQYPTLWGWDFAVMAMTATRLQDPETAINMLLIDSPKNTYVKSGNNRQQLRNDLPLYLPGNGSLLLAIPMMVAGYDSCNEKTPGFPKNGMWEVEFENIKPYV